jgi:hypothetical protein
MNRILYQLSYAAIFAPQKEGKHYYRRTGVICQPIFSKSLPIFPGEIQGSADKTMEIPHNTPEVIL